MFIGSGKVSSELGYLTVSTQREFSFARLGGLFVYVYMNPIFLVSILFCAMFLFLVLLYRLFDLAITRKIWWLANVVIYFIAFFMLVGLFALALVCAALLAPHLTWVK